MPGGMPPFQPIASREFRVIRRRTALVGAVVASVVALFVGAALGTAGADRPQSGSASLASTVGQHAAAATVTATATKTVVHTVIRPGPTRTVSQTVTRTVSVPAAPVHAAVPSTSSDAAPSQSAANCTPGYSPCIPPGPDVDCAGGSGNGPRYVQGPITVTGSDPYGLDSDGNGIGCE
jgi:hypothetical protein